MTVISIAIEPIPANPGYVAWPRGDDIDEEDGIHGSGATRLAAALDLARSLVDWSDSHPALCLAIAAVLREEAATLPGPETGDRDAFVRSGMERAAATVEGIA
jgi:hypothetical protein